MYLDIFKKYLKMKLSDLFHKQICSGILFSTLWYRCVAKLEFTNTAFKYNFFFLEINGC